MYRRDRQVAKLVSGEHPLDLLIVGGGITGAGIARDAARRGLRVALVDQGDLARGTSSRSSKLVHGGLRYLEQGALGLVFESVSERRVLTGIAPHLVRPLPFLFPVYKKQRRSPLVLDAGLWLYDGLSLFRSPSGLHRRLDCAQVQALEPALGSEGLMAAELYTDCATDDARLTLETALDAVNHGAIVATWCRVEGFLREAEHVRGVMLRDRQNDQVVEVRARAVVLAAGPWTDPLLALLRQEPVAPVLRPTKGVHLVVDHEKLPVAHANVLFHPRDGRVLFAIPWGERSYVGTTDTDWDGDPDEVAADAADVAYLLEAIHEAFPAYPVVEADVIATWAGLRPLLHQEGVSASAVSREHTVRVDSGGVILVAGGKLTTYRRMAAEVVDRVLEHLGELREPAATGEEPLPGAVGWPLEGLDALVASIGRACDGRLSEATCRNLAEVYGVRGRDLAFVALADPPSAEPLVPGRPEIRAQVRWAVERELASTLEDVLMRRTPLFFKDLDQGLGAAPKVAGWMAPLLGWDEARISKEIAAYEAVVARSRAWRS